MIHKGKRFCAARRPSVGPVAPRAFDHNKSYVSDLIRGAGTHAPHRAYPPPLLISSPVAGSYPLTLPGPLLPIAGAHRCRKFRRRRRPPLAQRPPHPTSHPLSLFFLARRPPLRSGRRCAAYRLTRSWNRHREVLQPAAGNAGISHQKATTGRHSCDQPEKKLELPTGGATTSKQKSCNRGARELQRRRGDAMVLEPVEGDDGTSSNHARQMLQP